MSKKNPKSKFKPNLTKTPNLVTPPHPQKKPRTDPNNLPYPIKGKYPSWRFGMIDFHGNWGWEKVNQITLFKYIQSKLKNFEEMTWGEIEKKRTKNGTPQNHPMPVDKICKDARDRLYEINLDDLDTLYSLRLQGLERLWGKRTNEILYIIWWDDGHTVYPLDRN